LKNVQRKIAYFLYNGEGTMTTSILGISAFYHDSAAALIRDGEIFAAAQEERFTRRKHDPGFPKNAINYCLAEGGIKTSELDYVVFYEKPLVKFERLMDTYAAFAPMGFQSFSQALPLWVQHKLHMPQEIMSQLDDGYKGQIHFTDHHESHAASAFFPSPFEEATILTMDAVGEWSTSSTGVGRGNRIELTHEMRFPHSLGMLYTAFTYYTGFKVNSGEYKLMGLAPYGQPRYVDLILNNIADIRADGSLWLDMAYFNYCQGLTMTSEKFHQLFDGPPRQPESLITQKEMDLAASIQVICEKVVLNAARYAHNITGMKNLVMAGGVALNCVANGRLLREGPFENIWIQPAAGDAGGALGAALLVWHHLLGKDRRPEPGDSQKGSLLGPAFSNDDIGLFLKTIGAAHKYVAEEDQLTEEIANLMVQEKVIGWFQGRMEYGPRALGCRSIIGDARSAKMQKIMNLKIKFRESFRPFAPCVLREFADKVFEMRPNEDNPYMLFVAQVREDWRIPLEPEEKKKMQDPDLTVRVSVPRSKIPAITHIDYSARVQTVDAERHGRYYRLMRKFYELTDCPVIVNTSFNIRGEPIVCTPNDAFRCFMATDMDCLVLENYVLMKTNQPSGLMQDADAYRAQYELD
jgi:carbamoyltransferase